MTYPGGVSVEVDDPYRYGRVLSDFDLYLFGEGKHTRLYDKLGAHPMTIGDAAGVHFAVWAPNAHRVSVVGDFNDWDGRRHPMRVLGVSGVWEIFVPGAHVGHRYKFEILSRYGEVLLKSDPFGFAFETPAADRVHRQRAAVRVARRGVDGVAGAAGLVVQPAAGGVRGASADRGRACPRTATAT